MLDQNLLGNNDLIAATEMFEAETMIIGSVLMDSNIIFELSLEPEHFYHSKNKIIFRAMKEMAAAGTPIDAITVAEHLANSKNLENIGGISYLSEISNSVPTTGMVPTYQRIVLENYKKRKLTTAASTFLNDPSPENAEVFYTLYIELNESGNQKKKTKKDILVEIHEEMYEEQGDLTGIDTGFTDLNRMTNGWQGGDLIIVAARPSMGKTAFALNLAVNCCMKNGVADVFSLEMSEKQLTKRILSSLSSIEGSKWSNPYKFFSDEDREKATKAMDFYNRMDMYIHDEPTQTVADIRAAVRKTSREHPDQQHIVIIDYLQQITQMGKFDRHDLAIGAITRELKQMARQFNVPVILLSQLSRGVEQRQDKRPMMSDLRDSGSIEQDADIVMMLYRDDYYDRDSDSKNIVEVIVAKHRNGPVGTVTLAFRKELSKFLNLELRYDS